LKSLGRGFKDREREISPGEGLEDCMVEEREGEGAHMKVRNHESQESAYAVTNQ
jgi:hypothetical protein